MALAAYVKQLKDKQTKNWFKLSIACFITKQGLENFVDSGLQQFHKDIFSDVLRIKNIPEGTECNQCNTRKIYKTSKPCTQNICNEVYKMVAAAHTIKEPSWSNTQCWASSYWEVAKCFLPASGYEDKTGVKDTDFNGLVSLLMHCKHFQNNLSFNTADKNSVLWKAREIGRLIRHAAEPKITDQDMETHFNVLLELLEDPKCLRNDAAAKTAARDIKLLQIDDLALSTGEYGDMLRELHHTVTVVTEMIQKGNAQSENIERFIEEVLSSLNQLKSQFTRDLDTVGPVDFQNEMIKYYQNRLCTMPLSPLMPNRDGKLREFCVPLKIKKMGKDGKRLPGREEIHDYQSLFESPVKAEGSKCIIVQGEPGSGKTTFALRTILDWCDALTITSDSNLKSDKSDANPKANTSDANAKVVTSDVKLKAATCDNKTMFGKCGDRNKYFVDLDALKQFKFAFYIPLRHVIDLVDVDKMIKKTLVDKLYRKECQRINSLSLIQDLLSHEYCLVILDGLDEWSHSCYIVPEINLGCKCTCIILTRPWRLAEHPVSDFAIHSRLKITGITDKRLLIKRVLKCLDENDRQIDKHVNALLYEITEKSLDISSPIILMQLICIWHEKRTIGDSLCGIYATMVEMLLKRTKLKKQTLAQDLMQFDCCKNKQFVRENTDLIASLSELAFRQTFSDARETNILFGFDDVVVCLTIEQKEFALSSGILSQESTYSLCEDTTTFFFLHKTFQEFFAAVFIVTNTCLRTVFQRMESYFQTHATASVLGISQLFVFVCGLDAKVGDTFSKWLADVISNRGVNQSRLSTEKHEAVMPDVKAVRLLQNAMVAGFKEARANNQTNIVLSPEHYQFSIVIANSAMMECTLLRYKSRIKKLCISCDYNVTNEEGLRTVLQESSCSMHMVLTYADLLRDERHLSKRKPVLNKMTTLALYHSTCVVNCTNINVSASSDELLQKPIIWTLLQTMWKLPNVTEIFIEDINLLFVRNRQGTTVSEHVRIMLPSTVNCVRLNRVKMTEETWRQLKSDITEMKQKVKIETLNCRLCRKDKK